MLSVKDNNISLTRGDTAYFDLYIKDHSFQVGDMIELSVKKNVKDTEHLFKKVVEVPEEAEKVTLKVEPSDTANASFAEYSYDIQLTRVNGDVNTIIPAHKFTITKEVS